MSHRHLHYKRPGQAEESRDLSSIDHPTRDGFHSHVDMKEAANAANHTHDEIVRDPKTGKAKHAKSGPPLHKKFGSNHY